MAGTRNSGRKRKPEILKLVQGTHRKDRATPDAPKAFDGGMTAPAWLPREAVEHFGVLKSRVEALGLNSSTYTEVLATAAIRMQEIEVLTRDIEENGPVYWTTSRVDEPIKKANPAVSQRSEAMRHLQSLLAEFGLTPAAIQKVGGGQSNKPASPFAEFMNG